jgi:hypothetical protein
MKIQKIWVKFTLISIIIFSIALRLIKLNEFAIWGSDSGEHFFLLNQMLNNGEINTSYNGWGFAYPYFPGMHLLDTGFMSISEISTYAALVLLVPIIAGLSVILLFCISQSIFRDVRISLISAAFVGVVLPHVYSSSHPMPGSLGGFILLLCIFLLVKSYENKNFLIPLILCTFGLVITHHLTTYFLMISIIGIIIFREILQNTENEIQPKTFWKDKTKIDMAYLFILITSSLGYWFIYAEPFYDRIIEKNVPITPVGILVLAYLGIFILWMLLKFRRRLKWKYNPKPISLKNLTIRMILFWIFGLIVLTISLLTTVPGTNMKTDIIGLPIFLPIIGIFSFISVAPAFLFFYRNGVVVLGWMVAILCSLLFAFISNSQELLLYRHLPYIMEPIGILAGLGFVKFFDILMIKGNSTSILNEPNSEFIDQNIDQLNASSSNGTSNTTNPIKFSKINLKHKVTASSFIFILFVLCGLFAYPPLEVVSGFEEGTTQQEVESCIWLRENLPVGSTVASDHRMSSMVFGFGTRNATWEYAPKTFHEDSFEDIVDELERVNIPAGKKRIDYILLSKAIENGVALEQWETAQPMSPDAINKFDSEPFLKLYDNGDVKIYYYLDMENYLDQFSSE